MPHGRRLERRGRDECEQPRDAREHLRRHLQRGIDLAPQRGQVEREGADTRIVVVEQLVRVEPIAPLGGDAPGRRVRMREQPAGLELG